MKRENGKGSPEVNRFKQATTREYDCVFAYRFIYELRHYTQHCEMPIASVNARIDEKEQKNLEIFLSREKLLKGFNWKPIVARGLEECPENIELMSLINQVINCLENIHNVAINQRDTRLLMQSAMEIVRFNLDNGDKVGELAIIEYLEWQDESTPKKINIEDIPFKFATFLLKNMLQNG